MHDGMLCPECGYTDRAAMRFRVSKQHRKSVAVLLSSNEAPAKRSVRVMGRISDAGTWEISESTTKKWCRSARRELRGR